MRSALQKLRDAVLKGIASPVKGVVDKTYMKKKEGGYGVDVEVLHPVSLERTGEILKEISLSPLWMGRDGRGLYLPPEVGQIVVVSFVDFNRAHPFVAGFGTDTYTPADGKENAFVLTDGKGAAFSLENSLFSLKNSNQSLKAILESLIEEVIAMKTIGPPPQHKVSPDTILGLQRIKFTLKELFKE